MRVVALPTEYSILVQYFEDRVHIVLYLVYLKHLNIYVYANDNRYSF